MNAQTGLWGDDQDVIPVTAPARPAVNDLELVERTLATAVDPGFLVLDRSGRVVVRIPGERQRVELVTAEVAAAVAQLQDQGLLTLGGHHTVECTGRTGPARSVLVSDATKRRVQRWASLVPLPRRAEP